MEKPSRNADDSIGVTEFKSRCLSLVEDVASGRRSRLVLTRRGKAVAMIVPAKPKKKSPFDPWGALKGTVTIPDGVDLTEPLDEVWNAERE